MLICLQRNQGFCRNHTAMNGVGIIHYWVYNIAEEYGQMPVRLKMPLQQIELTPSDLNLIGKY